MLLAGTGSNPDQPAQLPQRDGLGAESRGTSFSRTSASTAAASDGRTILDSYALRCLCYNREQSPFVVVVTSVYRL